MDLNLKETITNHYLVPGSKVDDVRPDWMKEELSTGVCFIQLIILIIMIMTCCL